MAKQFFVNSYGGGGGQKAPQPVHSLRQTSSWQGGNN